MEINKAIAYGPLRNLILRALQSIHGWARKRFKRWSIWRLLSGGGSLYFIAENGINVARNVYLDHQMITDGWIIWRLINFLLAMAFSNLVQMPIAYPRSRGHLPPFVFIIPI